MDLSAALVFVLLFGPPVALLFWHIWRDLRGGKRNQRGLCYACAKQIGPFNAGLLQHYRGGAYLYCGSCQLRHTIWFNAVGMVALAAMVAIGVLLLLIRQ